MKLGMFGQFIWEVPADFAADRLEVTRVTRYDSGEEVRLTLILTPGVGPRP